MQVQVATSGILLFRPTFFYNLQWFGRNFAPTMNETTCPLLIRQLKAYHQCHSELETNQTSFFNAEHYPSWTNKEAEGVNTHLAFSQTFKFGSACITLQKAAASMWGTRMNIAKTILTVQGHT